jgi:hypothetical protein
MTQYSRKSTQKRKDIFWFTVSEVSVSSHSGSIALRPVVRQKMMVAGAYDSVCERKRGQDPIKLFKGNER